MSNLCPNASDSQSVSVSSKDTARRESHSGTSSHNQLDLDDLPEDHETSSEWKFERHIYFAAGRWPSGETYDDIVRAAVEEHSRYLPTVPVPVHSMEFFYNLAAEPEFFYKTPGMPELYNNF